MKYEVGTKLLCNSIYGIVIDNYKFEGDICVEWESGMKASYDRYWLDENTEIVV